MGFKKLKEHYRIGHVVQVTGQGICVGSGYIHDLIVVSLEGTLLKSKDGFQNDDLTRYKAEMTADPQKLREIVQEPDVFEAAIPVFTYDGGKILEKKCEKLGWPNVTHDGNIMYDNTYSTDRSQVVRWAIEEAGRSIESMGRRVREVQADLVQAEAILSRYQSNLAELTAENT